MCSAIWMFFTFFKLYKWYQIAQLTTNIGKESKEFFQSLPLLCSSWFYILRTFADLCFIQLDGIQGLMQKEKVDIDGEKSAQNSIVAKKTNINVTPDYDYGAQTSYILKLFCFLLLCSYCVTDMIKKLELCLLLVIILFKISPKSVHRCRKQPVSTPEDSHCHFH